MIGHTAGPWRVTPSAHQIEWSHWIDSVSNGRFAVAAVSMQRSEGTAAANARLIAAAPDLLAACQAIMAHVKSVWPFGHEGIESSLAWSCLSAAVERATGVR